MKSKLVGWLALLLLVAEVLLVFISWLLSATAATGVRSLLSNEGVRWLCGHYADILLSPLLVYMLLLGMALGAFARSGLLRLFAGERSYKERFALRVACLVLFCYVAVMVWLTAMPQAVLLSATGEWWPSPFSRALIPLTSLGLLTVSICYGSLSRTFRTLPDVVDAVEWGIARMAPLLIIYVLGIQFYESLLFVFS